MGRHKFVERSGVLVMAARGHLTRSALDDDAFVELGDRTYLREAT